MVTIAGSLTLERLEAAVDLARHVRLLAVDHDLGGEGRLRPAEQGGQHLAGLVAVVVDRLLAEDDEAGLLGGDRRALSSLATASGSTASPSAVSTRMPRSAPMASAVRIVSCDLAGPIETATISVAAPFSLRRIASSTAISSKGFIDILTLASSTPDPVRLDADLDVVVDHPLDGHEDFHWFSEAPSGTDCPQPPRQHRETAHLRCRLSPVALRQFAMTSQCDIGAGRDIGPCALREAALDEVRRCQCVPRAQCDL